MKHLKYFVKHPISRLFSQLILLALAGSIWMISSTMVIAAIYFSMLGYSSSAYGLGLAVLVCLPLCIVSGLMGSSILRKRWSGVSTVLIDIMNSLKFVDKKK